uniref:CSON000971 protein n=1 Tax=Culicoides sonorensis TaxID=179676 RepID=A0A336MS52_CULSO
MAEKLLTCPYNPAHQILPARMITHLTKCAKQYPDIKLEMCIFNANHRVKKEEMQAHKATCPDRIRFEQEMNPIDVGRSVDDDDIPMPRMNKIHDDDEEDWESDIGTKPSFGVRN